MKQQPKNMREARLQHQAKKAGNRAGLSLKKTVTATAVEKNATVEKGYFKTYFNRSTVIGVFIGTALAISVPSIASEGFLAGGTNPMDAHNNVASTSTSSGSKAGTGSINVLTTGGTSAADGSETAQANQSKVTELTGVSQSTVNADAQSCAESDDGLVKAAADALNMRTTVLSKVVDVNQIFQPKKQGGCFADLGEIPDLSVTIPTWSGMADKIVGALKDYANKKVCDAVYEASSQIVGPINESLAEIQKYSQAYDFAKEFAGVTGDKLGLDTNIFIPDKTEISYGIDGYQVNTTPGNGGGSVTGGSSSSSGGSSTPNGGSGGSNDPLSQESTLSTQKSSSASNASALFGQ